ncbi:hypothetical protein [Leucobacter sp.]
MNPGTGRAEVREIRAVLRRRGDRIGVSEVSYRIYLAVMLAIIVGAPAVRGVVLWLRDALTGGVSGATAGAAGAPGSLVAAALTALTALLVLAAAHGGPVHATLPQLDLLHTTPISRARLLAAPVRGGFAAGAAAGALLTGLVAAARALRGELDVELAAALLLAGTGVGALAAGAMLVGQAGRRVRAALAMSLVVLALIQWGAGTPPDPWSAVARLLGSVAGAERPVGLGGLPDSPLGLAAIPLLAGAALAALAPVLVSRMRWEALREQAAGADVVRVLAVSGDLGAALARLGAPVRTGRRWRLRPARGLAASIVRRDLLGIARTPARSLAALAGVVFAGALWGLGLAADGPVPAGLLGAGSLLLAFVAAAPWCRGLAAAAAGSGSAPLLPAAPAGLAARHLIVPALLAGAAYLGGALWGSTVPAGLAPASTAEIPGWALPLTGLLLVATALLLRVLSAFKGPLPMKLLAPVPTPMGDMAGLNVLLWSFDGPINAALVGALLGALWRLGIAAGGWPVAASIVSLLLLAGLLAWALARAAPSAQAR